MSNKRFTKEKVKSRLQRRLRMIFNINFVYQPSSTYQLLLPPSHWLPIRQSENKKYDRYFLSFLTELRLHSGRIHVLDIGANVGDTALAVISVVPDTRVTTVEGSPFFLNFLTKNTQNYENVLIVPNFVTVQNDRLTYASDGSTGHLYPANVDSKTPELPTVSVEELLRLPSGEDFVIWKSDTDGYDIPILLDNLDRLRSSCSILWFEYDPVDSFCDTSATESLLSDISGLSQDMLVFDNLGHLVFHENCRNGAPMLRQLTQWLHEVDASGDRLNRIAYFDVWILDKKYAEIFVNNVT